MSSSWSNAGSTPIEVPTNPDKLHGWDERNEGTNKPSNDKKEEQSKDVKATEQTPPEHGHWKFSLRGRANDEDGEP